MASLKDRVRAVEDSLGNLRAGIRSMESSAPGHWTWDIVEKASKQTDARLVELQSAIRRRARNEKRAADGCACHQGGHHTADLD